MRIIQFLFIVIFISSLSGDEFYRSYHYVDEHKISSTMKGKTTHQNLDIDAILNVRYLENNNTAYNIFWLENGAKEKHLIDIDSAYAPFLLKIGKNKNEFEIKSLKSLSKDREVYKKLLGVVEQLQFRQTEGIFRFKSSIGSMDVNQSIEKKRYSIEHLKQYEKNIPRDDIDYIYSNTDIYVDTNSSFWESVHTKEKMKFTIPSMKIRIIDEREFTLSQSDEKLDKNHWFFDLGNDISKWGFKSKQKILSLEDALKIFKQKNEEMMLLVKNNTKFEKWVRKNMDFLYHLSKILETQEIDDKVSRALFSKLGYLNTHESSQILAKVVLNDNLSKRDRFRSLMGFKNTSAPLDDSMLDNLIEYGLSSVGDDYFENTMGMILGTLARQRVDRAPEQYEKITEAIIDSIKSSQNKRIALNAAGNMLQTAPESLILSIEELISSDSNTENIKRGAKALSKIGRTNLNISLFEKLLAKEKNSATTAQLIKTSAVANDFMQSKQYKEFLTDKAKRRYEIKSVRMAALESLYKSGYAKNKNNKKIIRKMMINEKDSDISKILRKLYRDK